MSKIAHALLLLLLAPRCEALSNFVLRRSVGGGASGHLSMQRTWQEPQPQEGPLLFIGVITSPDNVEKRREIRDTWWNHRELQAGGSAQARFFVGHPTDPEVAAALSEESQEYHDIVWLDVEEGYDKLTNKTLSFLQWYAEHRQEQYVMKMDDDTWPTLDLVLPRLRSNTDQFSLMGHVFACAPVLADGGSEGKWGENPAVFDDEFYPIYAQGSGYIVSKELVHKILPTAPTAMLHNEDASVGFWIKTEQKKDPALQVIIQHMQSTLYGCSPRDLMTMNLWTGDMRCMWGKMERGEEDICCAEKAVVDEASGEAPPVIADARVDVLTDEASTAEASTIIEDAPVDVPAPPDVAVSFMSRQRHLRLRSSRAASRRSALELGTSSERTKVQCYKHEEIWDSEAEVRGDPLQDA